MGGWRFLAKPERLELEMSMEHGVPLPKKDGLAKSLFLFLLIENFIFEDSCLFYYRFMRKRLLNECLTPKVDRYKHHKTSTDIR